MLVLDTFNCIPFSELQFSKRIQPSVCNSFYVVKFRFSSSNGPYFQISNLVIVQKCLCFYVFYQNPCWDFIYFSLHKETALICKNWGSSFHHVYFKVLLRIYLENMYSSFQIRWSFLNKCFLGKLFLDNIFTCYTEWSKRQFP